MKAIVVGGGLAGLSTALALGESGFEVDVFERSSRLGGRASSVKSRELGMPIDTGQHVLLGCCTNLLDFYRRIGALDCVKFYRSYKFLSGGEQSTLASSPFPEPLHLMMSLLHLGGLSVSDKTMAGKLLWGAIRFGGHDEPASKWLAGLGQSSDAVHGFWEPILTGALNESLDIASSRYAAMVIRQGMLVNKHGLRLGVPQIPLGDLNGSLVQKALERIGVRIHLRTKVACVDEDSGRAAGVRTDDGMSHISDYVVVASDTASSERIAGQFVQGDAEKRRPVQVPIVTLHLWFRESISFPAASCIPKGRFHWCLDKTGIRPELPEMRSSVSLIASAAKDFIWSPKEEICKVGLSELGEAFGFKMPAPDKWAVVKFRDATFSPHVGCDEIRPHHTTSLDNLYLAGEWTNTGWPGTMEGAVRSGYSCAAKILNREGIKTDISVADLPKRGLTSLL